MGGGAGAAPALISGATTATLTPCSRRYWTRLRVVRETPLTGPNDSVARRRRFPTRAGGNSEGVHGESIGWYWMEGLKSANTAGSPDITVKS